MDWTKSFTEQLEAKVSKSIRDEFPYLKQDALDEIAQQCKQTIFSEQIREFRATRLREVYPHLSQNAVEEIAQQCKQAVSRRLTVERPRMAVSRARLNLLTLPPEIRNRISTLVVAPDNVVPEAMAPDGKMLIEVANYGAPSETIGTLHYVPGDADWIVQPALTQVCKQLREETIRIYYGSNSFLLHVWEYDYGRNMNRKKIWLHSSGTKQWLMAIGQKHRDMIKSVFVSNNCNSGIEVSGERFAAALSAAGVGLDNCVFKNCCRDDDDEETWIEVKAKEDSICSEIEVEWDLTSGERYWI